MHDLQAEELLEQVEVAIAVQEDVIFANAVRRDQEINRLPHRMTTLPQMSIMASRIDRQRDIMHFDDFELHQLRLNDRGLTIVAQSAQHFSQDQSGQSDAIMVETKVEPLRFGIRLAIEEIDPDGRVDNDH